MTPPGADPRWWQGIGAFTGAVARFAGARGAAALALVALGAVLEGLGILLLVPILAAIFGDDALAGATPALARRMDAWLPADLSPVGRLELVLLVFAGVMAARALVLWRRDSLLGALQVGFVGAQRAGVARRLAGAPWPVLARLSHARVTHLLVADVDRCGVGVSFLLRGGVAAALLGVQAAVALALSPALAVYALGATAAGAALLSPLVRRAGREGQAVGAAGVALTDRLGRFLSGMKMAMSQDLEGAFVHSFGRDLAAGTAREAAFLREQALLGALWGLIAATIAGGAMLIGFGALHLPGVVLLAMLAVLARLGAPAAQLHLGVQQVAYGLPSWRALAALDAELAAAPPAPPSPAGARPRGATIRLEDVRYRHGDDAGVAGVSLSIAPGEFLGLAGASGAGKTTLADLLAGLVPAQEGRIVADGVPLAPADLPGWRRDVSYVAQDAVMFNDTVRRNLLWGLGDPGAARIAEALRVAGADALVARLPAGLDSVLGEAGALVSGGERQRLAIARALLREPGLLILDEATGAIDVATEAAILARLAALDPRPTIVLVAHRTESLAACDRVVTLAAGRIA